MPRVPDGSLEIPILPQDGTLEPLDFRNRMSSSRKMSIRHISPERSPFLALAAGLTVACAAGAVFFLWAAYVV
jgi:hypothetical protein